MTHTVPLGELAEVVSGGTPKRSQSSYFGGGVPWVKIGDMLNDPVSVTDETISASGLTNSSAKLLPAGTLLLSIFATIGRTAVLGTDAATNQAIAGLLLRDEERTDRNYLRRYLEFAAHTLAAQGRGVAQANINLSILRSHPIPLPPIEEQRRIAAVLDAADALRTKRRQALAKLDTLTQAIFIDMFGDPGLPSMAISEFAAVGSGATPKKSEKRYYENGTIPWVTSGQLGRGSVSEYADLITELALKETAVKKWPAGTLLVAMYGEGKTRGHCAELLFESTTNQACAAIVLDSDAPVSTAFLKTFLMSRYEENRRLASGGVQPNLNLGLVKAMGVPIPSEAGLKRFSAAAAEVSGRLRTLQRSEARVESLFASLQQRAFRGEL